MAPLFPSSSLSSLNPGSLTAASLGGLAPHNATVPALYLYPLNYLSPSSSSSSAAGGAGGGVAGGQGSSGSDTWAPKHIALTNVHTKIGRQTSSKTAPGERNGYFDSKVLSRQHAEVWEEAGKIFIKDVKSSNGTFINGERLSSEGHESEPFELKSDDIVEFGIDIVGEDNKTIIHHKVAARVVCVFTEQDAAVAARAEQHAQALHMQQQQAQHGLGFQHQHQHGMQHGQGGMHGQGQGGMHGQGGQQQMHHGGYMQNGAGGGIGGGGGNGNGAGGLRGEGSMNMSMHQQHLAHLAQQAANAQGQSPNSLNGQHPHLHPHQHQQGQGQGQGQPQQIQPGLNGHMNGPGGAQAQAAAAAAARRNAAMGGLGGLGGLGGMGGPSSSSSSLSSSSSASPNGSGAPSGANQNGAAVNGVTGGANAAGAGHGGAPAGARPGKGGLSFDVILSRLQGEVQKSRETGLELAGVGGTLGEVGGVLMGGGAGAGGENNHLPNYPAHLPPVRPPPAGEVPAVPGAGASKEKGLIPTAPSSADGEKDLLKTSSADAVSEKPTETSSETQPQALISTLQSQLSETQSALAAHLDKVRALEGVLAEQAALRREVGMLRVLVETGGSPAKAALKQDSKDRSADALGLTEVSLEERSQEHDDGDETEVEGEGEFRPRYDRDEHEDEDREEGEEDGDEEDDDDDARSIATTMPSSHGHELESVAEEDEDAVDEQEDRPAHHEREDGEEEELAALVREVGEGLHVEELEVLDEEQRTRTLEDDEDEYLSDQEKREIDLRRKEDEADAAAFASHSTEHDSRSEGGVAETPEDEHLDLAGDADEDLERRRERADGVSAGRPHTPEPTRAVSSSAGGPGIRRRSLASPLSQVSNHALMRGDLELTASSSQKDDAAAMNTHNVHEQLQRLSSQLGTVLALTTSLEAQHAAAQGTIVALEGKVASLEGLLKDAEHALRSSSTAQAPSSLLTTNHHQPTTLTSLLAAWKSSVEGQWGIVQEEWSAERKRLAEAREEWEARKEEWDAKQEVWDAKERALGAGHNAEDVKGSGGNSGSDVQNLLAEHQAAIRDLQQQYRSQQTQLNSTSSSHRNNYSHGNGDALKHTGGLVTPPSPRSQSSDSHRRYGRRRRRSSASRGSRSPSPEHHQHHEAERARHLVDEPHPLRSEEGGVASAIGAGAQKALHAAERSLASPEPSVYSSVGSLDGKTLTTVINPGSNSSPTKRRVDLLEREATDELDPALLFSGGASADASSHVAKDGKQPFVPVNVQAAMGVMLLSVAAAAVMWKVTPE